MHTYRYALPVKKAGKGWNKFYGVSAQHSLHYVSNGLDFVESHQKSQSCGRVLFYF